MFYIIDADNYASTFLRVLVSIQIQCAMGSSAHMVRLCIVCQQSVLRLIFKLIFLRDPSVPTLVIICLSK